MNPKKNKIKIKILIVDDHAVVRKGLTLLIGQESDMAVCAEAENAEQSLKILRQQPIDLAVVDISLDGTDGIELTKKIKSQYPELLVLVLTMHDDSYYATRAFKAGANGYLTKREAAETIIKAIRLILGGKDYLNTGITQKVLKDNT